LQSRTSITAAHIIQTKKATAAALSATVNPPPSSIMREATMPKIIVNAAAAMPTALSLL